MTALRPAFKAFVSLYMAFFFVPMDVIDCCKLLVKLQNYKVTLLFTC